MNVNMNGAWYTLKSGVVERNSNIYYYIFQHHKKYGVSLMVESGNGGRVVNISSLAAISGVSATTGTSHYGYWGLELVLFLAVTVKSTTKGFLNAA